LACYVARARSIVGKRIGLGAQERVANTAATGTVVSSEAHCAIAFTVKFTAQSLNAEAAATRVVVSSETRDPGGFTCVAPQHRIKAAWKAADAAATGTVIIQEAQFARGLTSGAGRLVADVAATGSVKRATFAHAFEIFTGRKVVFCFGIFSELFYL